MNDRKVISATDGNILTDGTIYGKHIFLAKDADESKFHEITIEEYNKMLEEAETENAKLFGENNEIM